LDKNPDFGGEKKTFGVLGNPGRGNPKKTGHHTGEKERGFWEQNTPPGGNKRLFSRGAGGTRGGVNAPGQMGAQNGLHWTYG